MEDKLIVAVCGHPELYDSFSYFYRNRNKKDLSWKKVSVEVGESEEVCRKKWKSLRDTYLKERKKETEKRSGSAAGSVKKWKYSAVRSFLDRFVSPRETSGNMERGDAENQAAGYDQPDDQSETAAAVEPTGSFDGSEPGSPLSDTAAASPVAPSTSAAVPRAPRRRALKRPMEQPSEVERQLLEALRTRPVAPAPPPRSEDEHFLLSLVPSLERLPPQKKEYVKFQMHKLIYENSTVVLNLEQLEPIE
ncbi:transcription factor Adf-1-like [Triplophysa dalaica]|uniref:transcription factor Adf-1-like n=1 Tax=Triplophysa dalaica TaxID=1582913 RepID=UPI0024DFA1BE|nr:transcription factor Adf-1-like [Triplophysa dalaica]